MQAVRERSVREIKRSLKQAIVLQLSRHDSVLSANVDIDRHPDEAAEQHGENDITGTSVRRDPVTSVTVTTSTLPDLPRRSRALYVIGEHVTETEVCQLTANVPPLCRRCRTLLQVDALDRHDEASTTRWALV